LHRRDFANRPSISTADAIGQSATPSAGVQRWLRTPDAALYLAVGISTLNKLRVWGGGPAYSKLGATVVYDVADLDAWAAARKVRSTSQKPGS
jgi:hypothetical protein